MKKKVGLLLVLLSCIVCGNMFPVDFEIEIMPPAPDAEQQEKDDFAKKEVELKKVEQEFDKLSDIDKQAFNNAFADDAENFSGMMVWIVNKKGLGDGNGNGTGPAGKAVDNLAMALDDIKSNKGNGGKQNGDGGKEQQDWTVLVEISQQGAIKDALNTNISSAKKVLELIKQSGKKPGDVQVVVDEIKNKLTDVQFDWNQHQQVVQEAIAAHLEEW